MQNQQIDFYHQVNQEQEHEEQQFSADLQKLRDRFLNEDEFQEDEMQQEMEGMEGITDQEAFVAY